MAVQVYIWYPSDESSFGHVSVGLSDETYISWWPKEEASVFKKNVQGKPIYSLEEEIKMAGGKAPKTYTLLYLDVDCMKKFWDDFQSSDQDWKMLSLNCATVAHDVLCKGHRFFEGYKRAVWTPLTLRTVVKKYMEESMEGEACGKKVKKVGLF